MFVRWRPFHLALLLVQALWLNVVLPGHQRGLLVVSDSTIDKHCAESASHKCCPAKSDSKSIPDRKSRCAVCAYAARLTIAAAPIIAPTLLERRPEVATVTLETLFTSDLPPAYYGRGPPTL